MDLKTIKMAALLINLFSTAVVHAGSAAHVVSADHAAIVAGEGKGESVGIEVKKEMKGPRVLLVQ